MGGVGEGWVLKEMDGFQEYDLEMRGLGDSIDLFSSTVLLLLLHETLDLFHHRLGDFIGPLITAEIFGLNAGAGHVLDRLHQCIRLGVELPGANPSNHLGCRPESTDWVGNAFPCDIWCRAVDWLEHAGILATGIQIRGRSNSN